MKNTLKKGALLEGMLIIMLMFGLGALIYVNQPDENIPEKEFEVVPVLENTVVTIDELGVLDRNPTVPSPEPEIPTPTETTSFVVPSETGGGLVWGPQCLVDISQSMTYNTDCNDTPYIDNITYEDGKMIYRTYNGSACLDGGLTYYDSDCNIIGFGGGNMEISEWFKPESIGDIRGEGRVWEALKPAMTNAIEPEPEEKTAPEPVSEPHVSSPLPSNGPLAWGPECMKEISKSLKYNTECEGEPDYIEIIYYQDRENIYKVFNGPLCLDGGSSYYDLECNVLGSSGGMSHIDGWFDPASIGTVDGTSRVWEAAAV